MAQTKLFDEATERGYAITPPGMAHWAGTGPKGTTCRECVHWADEGRYEQGNPNGCKGELKPGYCSKYRRMMRQRGGKIKHFQITCKYFEKSDNPPPAVKAK